MYVAMQPLVTIGDVVFDHVGSVEIKQSVIQLTDTATMTLPRAYKLKDKNVLDYIKVGDQATIQLGYNGELHEEFSGYVREINTSIPLVIHLDDEMYQLKKGNIIDSWEKITLKELLTEIAPGYKTECPKVNLGKFQIDSASPFIVLQELKKQYGFYSWTKGKTLHCGFAYDIKDNAPVNHVYTYGLNIPKGGNQLKYNRKEDIKLRVTAIANKPNGKKLKVEIGSKDRDAQQRTLNFGDKTKEELKELANKELAKIRFDGYTGTIRGFGIPLTMAGDTLELRNMPEADGNGKYLIEAVTIKWGKGGYLRTNKLSYQV